MTITSLLRRAIPAALLIFLLATAAAPASVRTSLSGWFWGNPTPQGSALSAVDFLGSRGYAIGADGTTLRSDDAGATWSGLATGTNADLTRLQIIDADSIVVLGGDGCVLRRSDDGGATFQRLFTVTESGCPDKVVAFWFNDENTGFLVLKDGSVLKTTDKGQSFSKQTAVPGTAASATGGNGQVNDIVFPAPGRGIVFVTPQGSATTAYETTDDGISWKPLALPSGNVTRVYRYDATTLWTTGAGTLLHSTDGGKTFEARDAGANRTLTGIRCSTATDCLLTTDKGELLRTADGGATVTSITAASVPLASAAYASPAQALAVGAAGQMVISLDAGLNWTPIGGDVGGGFSRLRIGSAPTAAYAAGSKGVVGISTDGGATWKGVSAPTSADISDTSWSSTTTGYALDARGSLFRTANSGTSWQTLSAGAGGTPRAVLALLDGKTVLLIGPKGVRRSLGGGAFNAVTGKAVRKASLSDAERAGSAIVAWSARTLLASTSSGSTWTALKLPTKSTSIDDVAFQSATSGWLLSSDGSLWRTTSGGKKWTESLATGTNQMFHIAFGSPTNGFVSVDGLGTDRDSAYVLRTSDGGKSWRPQAIESGSVDDLIAGDTTHAYAIVEPAGDSPRRWLFGTATGGDAGTVPNLKISAKPASFTKASLKKAKGKVTITGTLQGAEGGEQIVVAVRARSGGSWRSQTVTAGANGGSFSAVFTVKSASVAVAQWRGDSGRRGVGTPALAINVK